MSKAPREVSRRIWLESKRGLKHRNKIQQRRTKVFMKHFQKLVAAVGMLAVAVLDGVPTRAAFRPDVRPGYGVTGIKWLSDYNPNLRGTDYDTPVYVMEGKKTGAVALIMAGTHPREIGGVIAAEIVLENAEVEQGKLFVIPCLNAAGMSVPDTLGQVPHQLPFQSRQGKRWLYYGDRRIPLKKGEKDPEEFVHPLGYIHKDGSEWRNINRNYPGVADGTPAQMVTFGVMELIRREKPVSCLDIHEATAPEEVFDPRDGKKHPGGSLSYSLITHPKYLEPCIEMILELGERGVCLKPEQSIPGFRGISHYEIGEGTACVPFLSETPNPAMNVHAVGADPIHDTKHPLEERVGITAEILKVWFEKIPEFGGAPLTVNGLPSKKQIEAQGVGAWLQ